MDAASCILLILSMANQITQVFNADSTILQWIGCWIFNFDMFVSVVYAGIFGLVIITLERYVKILEWKIVQGEDS